MTLIPRRHLLLSFVREMAFFRSFALVTVVLCFVGLPPTDSGSAPLRVFLAAVCYSVSSDNERRLFS